MKIFKDFKIRLECELWGDETAEEINQIKQDIMNCTGEEICELFNDVNGKVGIDGYNGDLRIVDDYDKKST